MYSVPKPSKKYKESRPKRDDLELEELAERLTEAKESNTVLTFSIWRWEDPLTGIITNMDIIDLCPNVSSYIMYI